MEEGYVFCVASPRDRQRAAVAGRKARGKSWVAYVTLRDTQLVAAASA